MAGYRLTKADMDKIDREEAAQKRRNITNTGYHLTKADMDSIDHPSLGSRLKGTLEPHGDIYNLTRALANAGIDIANLPMDVGNVIAGAAKSGAHPFSDIPRYQTDPSIFSTVGDILGYLTPAAAATKLIRAGAGAAKGLEGIEESGGLRKEIEKLAERVPSAFKGRAAKTIGGNILLGGATAPTGSRLESGAIAGGTAGAVEGAGGVVAPIKEFIHEIQLPEAASRYLSRFSEKVPFNGGDEINREMVGNIGKNYVDSWNKSAPFYNKVFNDKSLPQVNLNDLKNYKNARANITVEAANKILSPEQIKNIATGKANVNDLHKYQSVLGEMIRNPAPGTDVSHYIKARSGLKADIANFLDKHGKGEDYKKATDLFKKNTAIYSSKINNKRMPMARLKQYLDAPINEETGLREFNQKLPLKDFSRLHDIVPSFIAKPGEKDLGHLNYLTALLGGDRAKAIDYTKHNIFQSAINTKTGGFDIPKFLKLYDKTSNVQKKAMFNPMQQDAIHKADKALNILKDKRSPQLGKYVNSLGNLIAGVEAATHIGGTGLERAAAGILGYSAIPLIKKAGRKTAYSFLPETQEELGQFLTKDIKTPKNRKINPFASVTAPAIATSLNTQRDYPNGNY